MYLGMLGSKGSIVDWDRDLTPKDDSIYNGLDYDSSAIDSAEYDGRGNMKVQYKGGGKKYDFPCSPDEWKDLKDSPSKGQWMYYLARRY